MVSPLWFPYPVLRYSVWERILLQGFKVKLWEKSITVLQTGYVLLPHLLPRTFRRKHLPPYTHFDTQWVFASLCTLRKWILSMRIRGFPGGEVHGKDRKFWKSKNADGGSCRHGQWYPSLPEDPSRVSCIVHNDCACSFHVYVLALLLLTHSFAA